MVFAAATVSGSLVSAMKSGTAYFGGSPGAPVIRRITSLVWVCAGGCDGGCGGELWAPSTSVAQAARAVA